eukprot:SAG11_NODE_2925_length_2834_cov_2.027788_1_plen_167_part_00
MSTVYLDILGHNSPANYFFRKGNSPPTALDLEKIEIQVSTVIQGYGTATFATTLTIPPHAAHLGICAETAADRLADGCSADGGGSATSCQCQVWHSSRRSCAFLARLVEFCTYERTLRKAITVRSRTWQSRCLHHCTLCSHRALARSLVNVPGLCCATNVVACGVG